MTTPEAVRGAVEAYYAAITARDVDALLRMYAPGSAMRDPVGIPPATDDATRRQRYDGIAAAFETFAITPQQIVASANEAGVRWTAGGRARSGRDVTFDGISTFIFDDDGRITTMSAYWDLTAITLAMQQS
jgi:ketosteroid isomerase-like protein